MEVFTQRIEASLLLDSSPFNKLSFNALLLNKRGVEAHIISEFDSLLKNCELARYTPITIVTMQQDYDKAAKTISSIDKQIK